MQHTFRGCIEQKNEYLFFVDWERLEDHTKGCRRSEQYHKWKSLLHHYYDPFPIVEHYEKVKQ